MKTAKFTKQQRQVKRLAKNQAKSTKLSVKQCCNEQIKKLRKNKTFSATTIEHLIKFHTDLKASLFTNS